VRALGKTGPHFCGAESDRAVATKSKYSPPFSAPRKPDEDFLFLTPFRSSRRDAFTGLEIILTVALIALLAGSAIYLMRGGERTCAPISNPNRCHADIESIKTQLQLYQARHGHVPTTEQGLKALVYRPTGNPQLSHWRQLLPEMPIDPWGTEYQLRNPATKSTQDPYDLYSAGRDRQPNTADDIGNW
jgi:general secretion pathway protein G